MSVIPKIPEEKHFVSVLPQVKILDEYEGL